jgi:hypothetical protein
MVEADGKSVNQEFRSSGVQELQEFRSSGVVERGSTKVIKRNE